MPITHLHQEKLENGQEFQNVGHHEQITNPSHVPTNILSNDYSKVLNYTNAICKIKKNENIKLPNSFIVMNTHSLGYWVDMYPSFKYLFQTVLHTISSYIYHAHCDYVLN